MNFFELLYQGAAIGMGCYLGVIGMKAVIDLLNIAINKVNKKLSEYQKRSNKK